MTKVRSKNMCTILHFSAKIASAKSITITGNNSISFHLLLLVKYVSVGMFSMSFSILNNKIFTTIAANSRGTLVSCLSLILNFCVQIAVGTKHFDFWFAFLAFFATGILPCILSKLVSTNFLSLCNFTLFDVFFVNFWDRARIDNFPCAVVVLGHFTSAF